MNDYFGEEPCSFCDEPATKVHHFIFSDTYYCEDCAEAYND